ncbi:Terminase-like family protein [compost metagenome]
MQTGRWKVFRTCPLWLEEFRLYHRKDGKVVKERDDVISASRYALMMKRFAKVKADAAAWKFQDRKVV